jgi:hypothetical protein
MNTYVHMYLGSRQRDRAILMTHCGYCKQACVDVVISYGCLFSVCERALLLQFWDTRRVASSYLQIHSKKLGTVVTTVCCAYHVHQVYRALRLLRIS